MISSGVKTYTYENGDLQRAQWVRADSWSSLRFLFPEPDGTAFDCFCNIYRNYLIPAFPWIFGKYTLTDGVRSERIAGKLPIRKTIRVSDKAARLTSVFPDAALKINTSFFIMDPYDVQSRYDTVGTPFGLMVCDGVVISPPLYRREALLVRRDGEVSVRIPELSELQILIGDNAFQAGRNAEIFSRPEYKRTPPIRNGTAQDLVIIGRQVEDVSKKGRVAVPGSGFVLRVQNPASFSRGDKLSYRDMEQVQFAIQGGNSTLIGGKKTDSPFARNPLVNFF